VHFLVLNPGSNSLKAGILDCQPQQATAADGVKLVEVIIEGIGNEPRLSVYEGKKQTGAEPIAAKNMEEAATELLRWLEARGGESGAWRQDDVHCVCVRVVHGGPNLTEPTEITAEVEKQIADLGKWAPLHNRSSLEILPPLRRRFPDVPLLAVFDTAFHSTIPDVAGLYAIPLEISRKHQIRRYGFHGISHRYMLERYATIAGKRPGELNLVTMHLESGCSVTAIARGRSVDNTMGLTPLEGLMMGTRSGDVDPSLLPFLVRANHLTLDEGLELLEKQSGLLGVSGKSLDTRVLMREYDHDPQVRIAMEMFSYRVLKAVGGYLAALGGADAVIFGGGIAENTPFVRQRIGEGLRWCGLEIDPRKNRTLIDIEGRLSTETSRIQAYVIPVEENLEIAHECNRWLSARGNKIQRPGTRTLVA
jgi:acetate kinase